jgi:hypothetical protein
MRDFQSIKTGRNPKTIRHTNSVWLASGPFSDAAMKEKLQRAAEIGLRQQLTAFAMTGSNAMRQSPASYEKANFSWPRNFLLIRNISL